VVPSAVVGILTPLLGFAPTTMQLMISIGIVGHKPTMAETV